MQLYAEILMSKSLQSEFRVLYTLYYLLLSSKFETNFNRLLWRRFDVKNCNWNCRQHLNQNIRQIQRIDIKNHKSAIVEQIQHQSRGHQHILILHNIIRWIILIFSIMIFLGGTWPNGHKQPTWSKSCAHGAVYIPRLLLSWITFCLLHKFICFLCVSKEMRLISSNNFISMRIYLTWIDWTENQIK